MPRYLLLALLSLSILAGILPAAHAASYDFTPIDVPFSGADNSSALGINNYHQIVGVFRDTTGTHGFLDEFGNGISNGAKNVDPWMLGSELLTRM
jgi:hypothetical protein